MELYTKPAINLLGSALVAMRFFTVNENNPLVIAIIPEFSIEKFFLEYESFMDDFSYGEDLEYFDVMYPLITQYFIEKEGICVEDLEAAEIEWALDMGIPPGFPAYFQGYEII